MPRLADAAEVEPPPHTELRRLLAVPLTGDGVAQERPPARENLTALVDRQPQPILDVYPSPAVASPAATALSWQVLVYFDVPFCTPD